jgi:hypothetical protein
MYGLCPVVHVHIIFIVRMRGKLYSEGVGLEFLRALGVRSSPPKRSEEI